MYLLDTLLLSCPDSSWRTLFCRSSISVLWPLRVFWFKMMTPLFFSTLVMVLLTCSSSKVAIRRNIFTAALVRRVVHIVAGMGWRSRWGATWRTGGNEGHLNCSDWRALPGSMFILLFRWAMLVTTLLEFCPWWQSSCISVLTAWRQLVLMGEDHSNSWHSLTGQDSYPVAKVGQGVAFRIMEMQGGGRVVQCLERHRGCRESARLIRLIRQPTAGQGAGSQAVGDRGGCPEGSYNKAAGRPA